MLLHAEVRGDASEPSVVLLHGLMGSAESWHELVPLLGSQGFRVVALDLPGHGLSPRDPALTVASAAASVVETVRALGGGAPVFAVGHSYGGSVLAEAADALGAGTAVYVDAGLAIKGGADRRSLTSQYALEARGRSVASLRARSEYTLGRAVREERAAARFDAATSASISCGDDLVWAPAPGSIVVRASPSRFVPDALAAEWSEHGVDVRSIPHAAHTLWYSHPDAFTATLPELFAPPPLSPSGRTNGRVDRSSRTNGRSRR